MAYGSITKREDMTDIVAEIGGDVFYDYRARYEQHLVKGSDNMEYELHLKHKTTERVYRYTMVLGRTQISKSDPMVLNADILKRLVYDAKNQLWKADYIPEENKSLASYLKKLL